MFRKCQNISVEVSKFLVCMSENLNFESSDIKVICDHYKH